MLWYVVAQKGPVRCYRLQTVSCPVWFAPPQPPPHCSGESFRDMACKKSEPDLESRKDNVISHMTPFPPRTSPPRLLVRWAVHNKTDPAIRSCQNLPFFEITCIEKYLDSCEKFLVMKIGIESSSLEKLVNSLASWCLTSVVVCLPCCAQNAGFGGRSTKKSAW